MQLNSLTDIDEFDLSTSDEHIYAMLQDVDRNVKQKQNTCKYIDNLLTTLCTSVLNLDSGISCSICWEQLTHCDTIHNTALLLNCNGKHIYCKQCIFKWFVKKHMEKQNLTCPVCRDIVEYHQSENQFVQPVTPNGSYVPDLIDYQRDRYMFPLSQIDWESTSTWRIRSTQRRLSTDSMYPPPLHFPRIEMPSIHHRILRSFETRVVDSVQEDASAYLDVMYRISTNIDVITANILKREKLSRRLIPSDISSRHSHVLRLTSVKYILSKSFHTKKVYNKRRRMQFHVKRVL